MFNRKKYQEPAYEDDYEDVHEDAQMHDEVQEQPAPMPEQTQPQMPEPTLCDSIIIKIHTTYENLKDATLESENLLDDANKANLVDYMPINQNILSYVGYIRGLLEILNESNYVTGEIANMEFDQKIIARFTSEFESLVDLLAKNDEYVQSAFKVDSDAVKTTGAKVVLQRLNESGYQKLHRDISSRIGYMDALLEILTDTVNPGPNYARDFN